MGVERITCFGPESYADAARRGAQALRGGKLVVFPTETVYGIAAQVPAGDAVQRLRELKGRTDGKPFTVHLGKRGDARLFVNEPSPVARRLMRKGWPGPLTLVVEVPNPERAPIAGQLAAEQLAEVYHQQAVGLRCPDHVLTQEFLTLAGQPTVASSANRAGGTPPKDCDSALAAIGERVDVALDGGGTRYNEASTIVRIAGDRWEIVRVGVLDERIVTRMANSEVLFICTGNSCRSPLAEHLFRDKLMKRLNMSPERFAKAGYRVSSAGTFAMYGGAISEGSREELARRGLDGNGHRSQPLTAELLQRAERVYAMTPDHRAAALDLAPGLAGKIDLLADGPIEDPMGGGPDDYRRCAEQIDAALEKRLEEFLHEDRDW